MRRNELLATALGAVLLTSPALAQRGGDAVREMHREQANSSMPSVPMQDQASTAVDRAAMGGSPSAWLEQAQAALRRNRMGEANELLERAETRLLTRSPTLGMDGGPSRDPAVSHVSAARSALMARDRAGAAREAEAALASLGGTMQGDSMAGTGSMVLPSSGTGMGSGSMIMRDGAMAGTTMSRADLIILAQGGGGGGGGGSESGTGGVSSATPGSPAVGNLGSTPQEMQGRSQQPAQGAATTLAPTQGRGAADPSANPGRMQTAPGGTGVAPGDQPRR